jgi:hypothetical protein
MAYSRWIESVFYAYWASNNPNSSKNEQVLRVALDLEHDYGYTYEYISRIGVLAAASALISQYMHDSGTDLSAHTEELEGYMKQFLAEVDYDLGAKGNTEERVRTAMESLGFKYVDKREVCSSCGGHFDAPHFCAGKPTGNAPVIYSQRGVSRVAN